MFAKPAAAKPTAQQYTQAAKTWNKGAAKSGGKTKAAEAPREAQPPAKKVCSAIACAPVPPASCSMSGKGQRQWFWFQQLLQCPLLQLQWLRPRGCKLQQAQEGCLRGRLHFWLARCSRLAHCCQDLWAASYEPNEASGDKEAQDNRCLVNNSRADLISALKARLKRDLHATNDSGH